MGRFFRKLKWIGWSFCSSSSSNYCGNGDFHANPFEQGPAMYNIGYSLPERVALLFASSGARPRPRPSDRRWLERSYQQGLMVLTLYPGCRFQRKYRVSHTLAGAVARIWWNHSCLGSVPQGRPSIFPRPFPHHQTVCGEAVYSNYRRLTKVNTNINMMIMFFLGCPAGFAFSTCCGTVVAHTLNSGVVGSRRNNHSIRILPSRIYHPWDS